MDTQILTTTTQDFKTHFASYVRLLQENPEAAIIVEKYNQPVGVFMPYKKKLE